MSVEYSAVLIVGVKASDVIEEITIPHVVPVYDRRTGEQTGVENDDEIVYKIGGVAVDTPTEFMLDKGLEFVLSAWDSKTVYGRVIDVADTDKANDIKEVSPDRFDEAAYEVWCIFKDLGIDMAPKVMLVLQAL